MDEAAAFDPFDPEVLADPHPHYRRLRQERPVHHVATRDYWVVTRRDDCHALLRDHAALSSARGVSPEPGPAIGLIGTDPPDHTRLRRLVQGVFTPKTIERTWGARIAEICAGLVDEVVACGAVDAVERLSLPLPIRVIAELLGVPDGDLGEFKRWSDDMVSGANQHLDDGIKRRTQAAFAGLCGYFAEKIGERRRQPGTDLISLLVLAGEEDRLSGKELVQFCVLLLIAGNETTTNLLGNGLLTLCQFPAEQARLRANPELVPAAIEEMLRFCPPTQNVFRHAVRPIELRGVTIPADRRVMLAVAAANRDEAVWPDGDVFRVDRPAEDHVSFGSGIHFCLGSALARLEMRSMLGALLARTRGFELAGAPEMVSTILVRGPVKVPMAFV